MFAIAAGVVTAAAGGLDQELVLFYAASVFVSLLAGLVAMDRSRCGNAATGNGRIWTGGQGK